MAEPSRSLRRLKGSLPGPRNCFPGSSCRQRRRGLSRICDRPLYYLYFEQALTVRIGFYSIGLGVRVLELRRGEKQPVVDRGPGIIQFISLPVQRDLGTSFMREALADFGLGRQGCYDTLLDELSVVAPCIVVGEDRFRLQANPQLRPSARTEAPHWRPQKSCVGGSKELLRAAFLFQVAPLG